MGNFYNAYHDARNICQFNFKFLVKVDHLLGKLQKKK